MKIFFIGDTHKGHVGIAKKFRPEFQTDEDHHRTIHENILECSGKRNHLWLMGDVCFKVSTFVDIAEYSERFGHVNVFLGNHDNLSLWRFCADFNNITVHGIVKRYGLWLSHCPMHPEELFGKTNVHGHCHRKTIQDDRYINVSAEVIDYKPITLEQIRDEISRRNVSE